MTLVRLQKYLAESGVASRRRGERMILDGKVKVNGRVVTELGTKVDPAKDRVQVGKRIVRPAEKGVILFHKPTQVVSTLEDPEGRPAISDYLTNRYTSYFPVGRLDWDSSGLIILTNDGEMAQHLLHPRHECERVYEVRVEGVVGESKLEKIRTGVRLPDGIATAKPTLMRGDDHSTWLRIVIMEGRNRLVRRMMDKLGHPVIKLRRISHGPFKLGNLGPGQIRKLTLEEYHRARKSVMRLTAKA